MVVFMRQMVLLVHTIASVSSNEINEASVTFFVSHALSVKRVC